MTIECSCGIKFKVKDGSGCSQYFEIPIGLFVGWRWSRFESIDCLSTSTRNPTMDKEVFWGVNEIFTQLIKVSRFFIHSTLNANEHSSEQSLSNGLVAIVDAQKCPWRVAREQIKFIAQQLLDKHLIKVYAIRSDAFSMQNCAKSYKKGEVRSSFY